MSLSLAGIIWAQIYWITETFRLQANDIDNQIRESLISAVKETEEQKTTNLIASKLGSSLGNSKNLAARKDSLLRVRSILDTLELLALEDEVFDRVGIKTTSGLRAQSEAAKEIAEQENFSQELAGRKKENLAGRVASTSVYENEKGKAVLHVAKSLNNQSGKPQMPVVPIPPRFECANCDAETRANLWNEYALEQMDKQMEEVLLPLEVNMFSNLFKEIVDEFGLSKNVRISPDSGIFFKKGNKRGRGGRYDHQVSLHELMQGAEVTQKSLQALKRTTDSLGRIGKLKGMNYQRELDSSLFDLSKRPSLQTPRFKQHPRFEGYAEGARLIRNGNEPRVRGVVRPQIVSEWPDRSEQTFTFSKPAPDKGKGVYVVSMAPTNMDVSGIKKQNATTYKVYAPCPDSTLTFNATPDRLTQNPIIAQNQGAKIKKERTNKTSSSSKQLERYSRLHLAVEDMIKQLEVVDSAGINEKDFGLLDSALKKELTERNLKLPYEFGLVNVANDTIAACGTDGFYQEYIPQSYKASLTGGAEQYIALYIPDKVMWTAYLMRWSLASSILFMLIICGVFGAAIATIMRQKKLSEIKSAFISNMSHELKTPIATVSLAADTINHQSIISNPAQIKYFTGIIKDENQRMHGHIERVLQMALLDKGDLRLKKENFDLSDLVVETLQGLKLMIENKGGVFNFSAEPEVGYMFSGDKLHISSIICNLVDNAVKYSKENIEVSVSLTRANDQAILSVADKGVGIPKKYQKKIFDRFYRVGTGDIHEVKGFGLGLSFVKAITELHGGFVEVESTLNEGSTFKVVLPLISENFSA